MFSVRSAVAACQVSEKTIRRHLPKLQEHGATVDSRGRWSIPYEALLAVDLRPGKPAGPDKPGHPDQDSDQVTSMFDQAENVADQLRDQADQAEISRLRGENELLRQLLAAKDLALTLALRQLPAGAVKPHGDVATDHTQVGLDVDAGPAEHHVQAVGEPNDMVTPDHPQTPTRATGAATGAPTNPTISPTASFSPRPRWWSRLSRRA